MNFELRSGMNETSDDRQDKKHPVSSGNSIKAIATVKSLKSVISQIECQITNRHNFPEGACHGDCLTKQIFGDTKRLIAQTGERRAPVGYGYKKILNDYRGNVIKIPDRECDKTERCVTLFEKMYADIFAAGNTEHLIDKISFVRGCINKTVQQWTTGAQSVSRLGSKFKQAPYTLRWLLQQLRPAVPHVLRAVCG